MPHTYCTTASSSLRSHLSSPTNHPLTPHVHCHHHHYDAGCLLNPSPQSRCAFVCAHARACARACAVMCARARSPFPPLCSPSLLSFNEFPRLFHVRFLRFLVNSLTLRLSLSQSLSSSFFKCKLSLLVSFRYLLTFLCGFSVF